MIYFEKIVNIISIPKHATLFIYNWLQSIPVYIGISYTIGQANPGSRVHYATKFALGNRHGRAGRTPAVAILLRFAILNLIYANNMLLHNAFLCL